MQEMEASINEHSLQSSELNKVTHNHILRLNIIFLAISIIGAVVMFITKTY